MQNHYAKIQELGAEMYAISVDAPDVSKAFFRPQGVKFPILSDESRAIITAYGVLSIANIAIPSAFIVDKDGIIQWKFIGSKAIRVKGATLVDQLELLTETPNTAPVISPVIPAVRIEADVPHTIDLSKYATDEEDASDALAWRADAGNNQIFQAQVAGHQLTIQPIGGMSGTANLTLTLVDSEDEEVSQVVRVTVNKPTFNLRVTRGVSMFHIPLSVTSVNDVPRPVMKLSHLFDILGGQNNVYWLITTSPSASDSSNRFRAFFMHAEDDDFSANLELMPGTGIIASLKQPVQVKFVGDPIKRPLQLQPGPNLIGIPRYSAGIRRLSDFTKRTDIRTNVTQITVHINGQFQTFTPSALVPGSANDIALSEGQAFIVTAKQDAVIRF